MCRQIRHGTDHHADGKTRDAQTEDLGQQHAEGHDGYIVINGTQCGGNEILVGLHDAHTDSRQAHEEALEEHDPGQLHRKRKRLSLKLHEQIHQLWREDLSDETEDHGKDRHHIQDRIAHTQTLFLLTRCDIYTENGDKCRTEGTSHQDRIDKIRNGERRNIGIVFDAHTEDTGYDNVAGEAHHAGQQIGNGHDGGCLHHALRCLL